MSNETAAPPKGTSAFEERYKLNVAKPLPEFDTPGGVAYLLTDNSAPSKPLYGLVHYPTVPIRNEIYVKLVKNPIPNLICPVDRGLMNVTADGKSVQRLVTAFDRPTGGPLLSKDGTLQTRVKAASIRQHVVLSALKALAALHKRGSMHRNLTAHSVFYASKDSDEVFLGECYSTPPAYKTPIASEPLETAFHDDIARGEGDPASDFFQLGAVLQSLYFGKNLTVGRNRESLLIARVNQGSFWAISGGQDVPGSLGTLIRGLMADELEERWVAEDILDWYEGLAKPKRTSMKAWSMSRPTTYKGIAFVDRRLLADAFAKDPRDAAAFLRKLQFPSWVQVSMRDEVMSERLESALGVKPDGTFGSPSAVDDVRMVARVCMFLHPTGPVRFKGMAIALDAMGSSLAEAYSKDNRDRITALVELLDIKFLGKLADIVSEKNSGFATSVSRVRPMMDFLNSKQLGKGMERVLYTQNPVMPCISQRFENVWIGSIKQMLMALDRIAERGGGRNVLSDRHVAGFIAAHGKDLDRELNKLAASQNDPALFAILTADFFGMLQRMTNTDSLPNLTEKLIDGLGPAVRNLKNKKRREKVTSGLDKLKKSGDLSKVSAEINLVSLSVQDAREFAQAKTSLLKIERERNRLSQRIQANDPEARVQGYRAARIIAGLVLIGVAFVTFSAG